MDIKAFVTKLTEQAKRLPAKTTKAESKKAALRTAITEARPAIVILLEKRYKPGEIAKLMTEAAGASGDTFTSRGLAQALPDLFPKQERKRPVEAARPNPTNTVPEAGTTA